MFTCVCGPEGVSNMEDAKQVMNCGHQSLHSETSFSEGLLLAKKQKGLICYQ